jgi:multidrug efflux system membrane fusion protein
MPVDAYDRGDTQSLISGNLLAADNQIDTTTGTARLKAVFDNKDSILFPNQFVNIHLVLENRPNALVVPTAAIQNGLNGSVFVWVVDSDDKGGHVAQMQPIKVALAEGQVTILDSGPAAGARVVVDGADRLRPDQPVTVSASHQRQTGQTPSQDQSPFGSQPAAPPAGKTSRNPGSNPGHRQ